MCCAEIMGEEEEEGEGYFEDGIELEEEDDVGETYVSGNRTYQISI